MRFLFALYILVLSVYPCSDKATCADEQKAGIAVVDTSDHDHTQTEEDICSPLCMCSCCAASVQLTAGTIKMPARIEHHTKFIIPYQDSSLLNYPQSIWQPPKIG